VERVLAEARKAKEGGASRYCMGAAWREPKERDMDQIVAMIDGPVSGSQTFTNLVEVSGQPEHGENVPSSATADVLAKEAISPRLN